MGLHLASAALFILELDPARPSRFVPGDDQGRPHPLQDVGGAARHLTIRPPVSWIVPRQQSGSPKIEWFTWGKPYQLADLQRALERLML